MFKGIGRVVSVLSLVAGVLSLVALTEQGMKLGYVAPLRAAINFYLHWRDFFLAPVEPYLQGLLQLLPWRLPKLNPAWRDVSILAGIIAFPFALRSFFFFEGISAKLGGLAIIVIWLSASILTAIHTPNTLNPTDYLVIICIITFAGIALILMEIGRRWSTQREHPDVKQWPWHRWGMTPAGLRILYILIGAAVFVACNAGLSYIGLE
ncbi:MAG: hypothetical protein WAW96_09155 [Alphaproteobacteria bacterium]